MSKQFQYSRDGGATWEWSTEDGVIPDAAGSLQIRWFGKAIPTSALPLSPARSDKDTDDVLDMVSKALNRAWQLGQTFWQQADSDSYKQNKKSNETEAKFDALIEETRAALARSATAGTTAAPAVGLSAEAIAAHDLLAWNRSLPKPLIEVTKELGVARKAFALLAERATAGNTAPTEAVEGGASALRAEPAGQQKITRLDALSLIREHSHRCYVAGVNCAEVDPKYMAEIEDALRSSGQVDWEANARCLLDEVMQLRAVVEAAAAGILATPAAAPGDLPPLPDEHYEAYGKSLYDAEHMREYGRACIASNAGAAPADAKPYAWTCGKCGANRLVEPCRAMQDCPMIATAYATPSINPPVGAAQEKE